MESKVCPTCEQEKEFSEYYSTVKKDGDIYYRRECKECVRKRNRQWKVNNPEKHAKHRETFEAKPERIEYLKENGIRQRETGYSLEWQRENPEKCHFYNKQHDEHKIGKYEWIACKEYFNNECAYCGLKLEDHYFTRLGITKNGDFHKDHLIHDGSNYLDNCIPACRSCNCSKHTDSLEDWYNIHNPNFTQDRYNKIIKWTTEDYRKYLKPRKELVTV